MTRAVLLRSEVAAAAAALSLSFVIAGAVPAQAASPGATVAPAASTAAPSAPGPSAPFAAGASAPLKAAPLLPGPIVTRHEMTLHGRTLAYVATFTELPLPEGSASPLATIAATSYVVPSDAPSRRPVLVLFNGGPGASSSPLHFNALGPVRLIERTGREPARQLEPNPDTLLDAADLVFVDPVGTGYSRVLKTDAPSPYLGIDGDARAALAMIRHWLKAQGREDSPLFIGGQSYGGFRVASLMRHAKELPRLDGLLLVSPLLDMSLSTPAPGNELLYAMDLPSMAVAAWRHGRGDRRAQGESVGEVFDRARDFVRSDYLPALMDGSRLAPERRDALAARMSALIGLDVEDLKARRLRVDSEYFLTHVLNEPGRRLGRLDTRVTGSSLPPPPGKPTNDPSLQAGGAGLGPLDAYFRQTLRVPVDRKYVTLSFDVNGRWNWHDVGGQETLYLNPTRHIADVMRERPAVRLLYTGGYFDMATTVGAAEYALDHAGLPMARVRMERFASAHSTYDDDANLARFSKEVRRFLQER
ncbi:hypothetical protein [Mitsuaria sp. GD03876]|uniref:S10 family serine carboxypeptidase-like protein n=1 Tax=Mitsuaria sp. GD03876 TaxID=2975399 RepID=UPI002448D0B1|nr:hypothetical protein [Mitsuaria sp. GD03876]MDH0867345.1 hypothetical protein [Mitsuaria sp. GD03876]